MRCRVSWGIVVVAVGVVLLQPMPTVGQTTGQDVGRKVSEALEAIKDYTVERKNDAVAYGRKLLSELDPKIKELEAATSRASGEAKVKLEQQLQALRKQRAQTAKKLDELGKASAQSWDKVKRDFADAYRELHEQYDKAAGALRK